MLESNVEILRFNIKGGYTVKRGTWRLDENDPYPTKVTYACSDNGDYIGDVEFAKFLYKSKGITSYEKTKSEHGRCSIGFSPRDKKWYGWSHRAIYGFGIGSEVKKGDCAYVPANRDEHIEAVREWHDDDMYHDLVITPAEDGIHVSYNIIQVVTGKVFPTNTVREYFTEYGKGEWKAETLDDAKQMAIDFALSVS